MAEALTRYKVITGTTLYDIQREVEAFLGFGYKPQGGVAVIRGAIQDIYYQAMVK